MIFFIKIIIVVPLIMWTTEPKSSAWLVNRFWACSVMPSKHKCFWYPFFISHLNKQQCHHLNIDVQLSEVTESSPLITSIANLFPRISCRHEKEVRNMASGVGHSWGHPGGNSTLMLVLDMFPEQIQTLSSRKCRIPCSVPHAANTVPHAIPRAACLWVSCPGCSHVWNCQQGSRACRRCIS